MKKLSLIFVLYILLSGIGNCQTTESDEYTFLFYNSENLFDTENDSLTNDEEFTPEGDRRWNKFKLQEKASRMAKVILASGKWNPPVVVGLCEIEGRPTLELLVNQTPLRKVGYKIIHKDSPDKRGIDVAFIYRADLFKPFDYQLIPVSDPLDPNFRTRDILLVSGILNQCDTLHFFVNHWPSRYGGVMETKRLRNLAAGILKESIRKLFLTDPKAMIVCMGDLNDTPEDESLSSVLNALKINDPDKNAEMINLSYQWMNRQIQTLKHMYTWQVFDQWIVSDYFVEAKGCMEFLKAEIVDEPFLLETDKKYGGVKPKRTFIGFKYQEGFSDHLPIAIRYKLNVVK